MLENISFLFNQISQKHLQILSIMLSYFYKSAKIFKKYGGSIMDYTCRTRSLTSLTKDISNGNIQLTHKLQRKEGQWNSKQRSELIDSLLRKYPINPTYGVKENGKVGIIDGVQRLSTIRDYIDNKFALSKILEKVTINDKEYDIAGKKFKKLEEVVQEELLKAELQVYELRECTDKEVREMFARQNSGKPLSNTNKRSVLENEKVSESINSLASHPFFSKIVTKTQSKSDLEKDIVRQVLMITSDYEMSSFRSNDINKFVVWLNDNLDTSLIKQITDSLDKLDAAFVDFIKIKKLVAPLIVYGMYKTVKSKKSTQKYIDWLKKFIEKYDDNKDFLKYCESATASADMVKGRVDYFTAAVNKL